MKSMDVLKAFPHTTEEDEKFAQLLVEHSVARSVSQVLKVFEDRAIGKHRKDADNCIAVWRKLARPFSIEISVLKKQILEKYVDIKTGKSFAYVVKGVCLEANDTTMVGLSKTDMQSSGYRMLTTETALIGGNGRRYDWFIDEYVMCVPMTNGYESVVVGEKRIYTGALKSDEVRIVDDTFDELPAVSPNVKLIPEFSYQLSIPDGWNRSSSGMSWPGGLSLKCYLTNNLKFVPRRARLGEKEILEYVAQGDGDVVYYNSNFSSGESVWSFRTGDSYIRCNSMSVGEQMFLREHLGRDVYHDFDRRKSVYGD